MYGGLKEKKIEATVFMGPTYCHRLKHLLSDKIISCD